MRLRRLGSVTADPPPWWAGCMVAAAAVAAITAIIYPLRHVSPPVSNGVLYLLAVWLVATQWGLWLGLLTSAVSAAAFNFFYLPPVGRFTIADERNWIALGLFLLASVLASSLADVARARAREADLRRREADLTADMARLLLGGATVQAGLGLVGRRLAEELGVASVSVELSELEGGARRRALALHGASGRLGTLLVPIDADPVLRLRERIVPALEALLEAALEREALQAEVIETRALRRSDEVKTALLRSVSHDLRTPLTAIVTAGEMLTDDEISAPERAELAAAVTAEAARLGDLVEKLLDLSRLHAGAAVPRREWCSIEELLQVAVDHVPDGRSKLHLSIDPGLPLIRADAVQIERALANLLENSARYRGEHPVSVRARAVGSRLVVRIVDRGPGLPASELERVFEAFYRARSDRTAHSGSGLGLAIVKGFIEANGGRVWAESLPGQGATFVVELPLQEQLAASPEPAR